MSGCCSPAKLPTPAQRAHARRHAGRHRRAWPRAERAGGPHDARRGARGAAGRGRRRHPRLRLGDPRLRGSRRPPSSTSHAAPATAARRRRRRAGRARRGARREAARFRATATRCTRAPTRASRACSPSPREPGVAGRHVEVARGVEALLPELTGKPLVHERLRRDPAVLLDAGFPLLALKGVPILARTASLIAHLLEEQRAPDRLRAVARRRPRASATTARCPPASCRAT